MLMLPLQSSSSLKSVSIFPLPLRSSRSIIFPSFASFFLPKIRTFFGIFYNNSVKVESLCYRGFYVSTNVSGMKRILYQYSVEILTNFS